MATDSATIPENRRGRRQRPDLPDWVYPVAAIVLCVVAWDLIVRILDMKPFILPGPALVVQSLFNDWGELGPNALTTFYEVLLGFFFSVIIGIPLAVGIVAWRPLEKAIYPSLVTSQVVPKIAIAPLFLIWFGLGITPKIIIAFSIAFFPVVIDTVMGLRSLEVEKTYLARSMGATTLQSFFRIRLPNAMPYIFSGLKMSITFAVTGAIVGEFVGADKGIGRVLLIANGNLDTDLLFAGIVLLTIMGIGLFLVMDVIEKIVVRWHVSQRGHHHTGL